MKTWGARWQRGSVSVEFALVLPVFLALVLGGVHFGRVLTTRHRLADAANYAVRAAAVRGMTSAGQVRVLVEDRLGAARGDCSTLAVTAATAADGAGLSTLRIEVTCGVNVGFGEAVLGAIGPESLTVTAAMPL